MPVGANRGGNLNVYLFEVGFIDVSDSPTNGRAFTVGVHPLLVAPRDVIYMDNSRSSVFQTGLASVKTSGGRQLRTVQMSGSFGVASRGLGPYIGTGFVRFKRFYDEVVRLGEALNRDDVKLATDLIRGTPGLPLLTRPYDPDRHAAFINFYDFFKERQFSATVRAWQDSTHYDRGGAEGLVWYQMTLDEEGDIVTSSVAQALNTLFDGLGTWEAAVDAIESYVSLPALVQASTAVPNLAISQFNDTVAAVQAGIASARSLVGGFTPPTRIAASVPTSDSGLTAAGGGAPVQAPDPLGNFFTDNRRMVEELRSFISAVTINAPTTIEESTGSVDWSGLAGEGSDPALDTADQIEALEELAGGAEWNPVAGVLFGWDRESYQDYVIGQTDGGRANDLEGSIEHQVRSVDTAERLEEQYGIAFDRILELNALTPDEALFEGTTLQIPIIRGRGNRSSIDGLPTLGSHVGREAWGADLDPGYRAAPDGDFLIVDDEDVLIQGINWLIGDLADSLLNLINEAPPVIRSQLLQLQMKRLLLLDRRITSIDELVVVESPASAQMDVAIRATAINGATISTGGGL